MNQVKFTDIILPNSSSFEYNAGAETNSRLKQDYFVNSVQTDSKPMTPIPMTPNRKNSDNELNEQPKQSLVRDHQFSHVVPQPTMIALKEISPKVPEKDVDTAERQTPLNL